MIPWIDKLTNRLREHTTGEHQPKEDTKKFFLRWERERMKKFFF
jgi:hypothetical protein